MHAVGNFAFLQRPCQAKLAVASHAVEVSAFS